MLFERSVELPARIEESFAYHERPGALGRLIPPWEQATIKRCDGSLKPGSEVLLQTRFGLLSLDWLARHKLYDSPRMFSDKQITGPFSKWYHEHLFESMGETRTKLTDRIQFEIPFGAIGKFFGEAFVEQKLNAMFGYRHRVSYDDLVFGEALLKKSGGLPSSKTVAISGSHGLIGSGVVSLLSVLGYQVIRLERPTSKKFASPSSLGNCDDSHSVFKPRSIVWDPNQGLANSEQLNGIDAVIHLAGKGIADSRWTKKTKQELVRSRIDATEILANQLALLPEPPKAFVSASGIGIYGDRSDDVCDETQPASHDFLGELAKRWEQASSRLTACGTRVSCARLGIVLTPRGGALAKMLPIFRWGIGGRLGSGKQYWSWIDYQDAVSAFVWLALNPECLGSYNLAAGAVTNQVFTKELSKVLARPAWMPVPAFAIRAAMGEMADGLLLNSTRASGEHLLETGYPLRQNVLGLALRDMLGVQAGSDSGILQT